MHTADIYTCQVLTRTCVYGSVGCLCMCINLFLLVIHSLSIFARNITDFYSLHQYISRLLPKVIAHNNTQIWTCAHFYGYRLNCTLFLIFVHSKYCKSSYELLMLMFNKRVILMRNTLHLTDIETLTHKLISFPC